MSLFSVTLLPKLEQVLVWCLCVCSDSFTRGICLLLFSISANQNDCIKKDENQEVNNKPLKKTAAACCCQVTGFLCWLHFHTHVTMNRASVFCASFRFSTHAGLQHKHLANTHSFNTEFFFLKEQSLQEVVTKLIWLTGLATWKVMSKLL